LRSTSAITVAPSAHLEGGSVSASAQVNTLSCAPILETLPLFGESISTKQFPAKKVSSAASTETKARSSRLSLSDRLTPSLISAGLVKGITPKSVRQTLGQAIRDSAFSLLDGEGVA
jgi:hypothetical protein